MGNHCVHWSQLKKQLPAHPSLHGTNSDHQKYPPGEVEPLEECDDHVIITSDDVGHDIDLHDGYVDVDSTDNSNSR